MTHLITEVRKRDYTVGITEVRERIFRITDIDEYALGISEDELRELAWKLAEEALEFTGALCGAELKQNDKKQWYLRTIEA